MACKRPATTDLNDLIREEEEIVPQRRVIKTAKRRNPISSNTETSPSAKSAFGSFTGFGRNAPASTSFAFLNKITPTKEETSTANGISSPSIFAQPSTVNSFIHKAPENNTSTNDKDNEYYAKLKGLNESVSNWIKKHVDTNPLINLRPIFKDYERYFDELERSKPAKPVDVVSTLNDPSLLKKELSSFVFKPANISQSEEKKSTIPQFSFGTNSKENKAGSETIPMFNFASVPVTSVPSSSFSTTTKTNPSSSFSFGHPSTKPYTFANVAQPTPSEEKNDEQEDEPPKVQFKLVVEEGHTYTVRCKVFVKSQDSFSDRGIGTLYLKPIPDSEKMQLIVRADTNLGNVLCNFVLSKSIPTKRMGKKDVMLVCLPTPDSAPPAVPILLRVKSPEQADELLAELEKYKK